MCLNSLDRDEQLLGHFLVLVAASNEPHHLTLARAEPVQLLVDHGDLSGGRTKGVQDEASQPGAEDGIAVGDPSNRVAQVGSVDRLGDVTPVSYTHLRAHE